MDEAKPAGGGFRRGFLLLILLAVLIMVLYVMAPMIKTQVPALAGTMDAYVAAVDAVRVGLDSGLKSLVATASHSFAMSTRVATTRSTQRCINWCSIMR